MDATPRPPLHFTPLHSIPHRAPGTGGPAASHSLARGPGRGTRLVARQRRASRPGHRRLTLAIEVTTRAIEEELLASAGGRCWWLVEVVAVTVGERNAGGAANRERKGTGRSRHPRISAPRLCPQSIRAFRAHPPPHRSASTRPPLRPSPCRPSPSHSPAWAVKAIDRACCLAAIASLLALWTAASAGI